MGAAPTSEHKKWDQNMSLSSSTSRHICGIAFLCTLKKGHFEKKSQLNVSFAGGFKKF